MALWSLRAQWPHIGDKFWFVITVTFHFCHVITVTSHEHQGISLTDNLNVCCSGYQQTNTKELHYWPVTCGFPSQRANNVESVYMSWCHHIQNFAITYFVVHLLFWPFFFPGVFCSNVTCDADQEEPYDWLGWEGSGDEHDIVCPPDSVLLPPVDTKHGCCRRQQGWVHFFCSVLNLCYAELILGCKTIIQFSILSLHWDDAGTRNPSSWMAWSHSINRPFSQIPKCTSPISHNAPFRTEMCTFLFWMVHCGIWDWCIVGFVQQVNCHGIDLVLLEYFCFSTTKVFVSRPENLPRFCELIWIQLSVLQILFDVISIFQEKKENMVGCN